MAFSMLPFLLECVHGDVGARHCLARIWGSREGLLLVSGHLYLYICARISSVCVCSLLHIS